MVFFGSNHKGLSKIRFRPQLREYQNLASAFLEYLSNTKLMEFQVDGLKFHEEDLNTDVQAVRTYIPYIHRWTEPYLKSRLAKGYLLDTWYRKNPLPITMLTYTTFHDYTARGARVNDGYTIESTFGLLKDGFTRSRKMIKKIKGFSPDYLQIWEPHPKSGYPHIHVPVFCDFTEDEQARLKEHWSTTLSLGDYEAGLDFEQGTTFKRGEMTSIKNYMLKYMRKTLYDGFEEWTAEELVFNAVAWKNHFRTFQPSLALSRVMAPPERSGRRYQCVKTSLVGHGSNLPVEAPIWSTDIDVNRGAWEELYCGD